MKATSCCCCISVSTGTMILGVLVWLSLLSEIDRFEPFRLIANGFAAITFLLMAMDDTKQKRKNFFYCYAASQVFMFCHNLYRAIDFINAGEKDIIEGPC